MEYKDSQKASWGSYVSLINREFEKAARASFASRLWDHDPTLWKEDVSHHAEIRNRLGWLEAPLRMKESIKDVAAFLEEIKAEGFTSVVLLGMGGSSLAPEVFQRTFGNRPGHPKLRVLDSTDPEQVLVIEQSIDIAHSLFIVSSKSGGTIELLSFFKFFFQRVKEKAGENAGKQFIAITDPGSPLEALAKEKGFRRIFLGYPDVGGRFSALTPFGLVPAALIGVDVKKFLQTSEEMMRASSRDTALADNPASLLGIGMAALAAHGRDKLTILSSKELDSFGDWAEQLIAESSGKEGFGIIPVTSEIQAEVTSYGNDRFFVALLLEGADNGPLEKFLKALEKAGHPILEIRVKDADHLGAEFYRWEMATALACAVMKVDAFDQPDVQAAKDKAKALLKVLDNGQRIPVRHQPLTPQQFILSLKPGDYVGLLAFLPYREDLKKRLAELRLAIREKTKNAVTLGWGPRYLHSTGQLHKGGPDSGAFLLITAPHATDAAVPGEAYGFEELEFAQAMGDCEALESRGRRVLHLRLEIASERSLGELQSAFVKKT